MFACNVNIINKTSTPGNPSPVDFRYSGAYIIADIEYVWDGKKMSQNLRLVRKELGKTPDEIKNAPPVKKEPEVKENNPNPVATEPTPNSVYNVGQTYLVQDKNGKLYNLTVTKLLDDGIQVTGILKESPTGMSQSSIPASSATTPAPTPAPTPEPTPTSTGTEFTIGLLNPISEVDKKISGVITISKKGPLQTANGTISGFPDGGAIGPISGQPAGTEISAEQLANEMLHTLESSITTKYKKEIKLKIISKK